MYECKVRNMNYYVINVMAQPWESVPTRARFGREAEAIAWCAAYNLTHESGRLSRKADFTAVYEVGVEFSTGESEALGWNDPELLE